MVVDNEIMFKDFKFDYDGSFHSCYLALLFWFSNLIVSVYANLKILVMYLYTTVQILQNQLYVMTRTMVNQKQLELLSPKFLEHYKPQVIILSLPERVPNLILQVNM